MALNTPHQPELLTSWKEIASYLGKGVRTVQRWEQQFGLPVRRPNERVKGIVHATREELDHWLAAQWSQRSRELTLSASANENCAVSVRANIEQMAALRDANRRLVHDMHMSLNIMYQECQSLALQLAGTRKPD
jgi:hypothetical protein